MKDLSKLIEPFDAQEVKWRVGTTRSDKTAGLALAYVDARVVMERLDDVIGTLNWEDQYTETAKGRVLCSISIKDSDGNWITKSDGAGSTTFEGEKGAISDAFKRAAVKWGIGRYLYNLDSPWVKLEKNNIKKSELVRLQKLLPNATPSIAGNNEKESLEKPPQNKHEDLSSLSWWQADIDKFKNLGEAQKWKTDKAKKINELKANNYEAFKQLVKDFQEYEGKHKPKEGSNNE